ncbi:MAG: hypothetical protein NVSMB1_00850 [Polyangiales bacterium]
MRSAKGIALVALCTLGGAATAYIAVSVKDVAHRRLGDVAALAARKQTYSLAYGPEIGKSIADVPEVLFLMMTMTLGFSAILATLVGFDAVSADLHNRSVRYFTVRARRSSYLVAKFLGIFMVTSLMTFVMHALSWAITILRGDYPVAGTLAWGFRFWLVSLPISAAWCALAVFVSSLFRSSVVALLCTIVSSLALWSLHTYGRIHNITVLTWIHPGAYDRLLLSPNTQQLLNGVFACAAWAFVFVAAGVFLFRLRDV